MKRKDKNLFEEKRKNFFEILPSEYQIAYYVFILLNQEYLDIEDSFSYISSLSKLLRYEKKEDIVKKIKEILNEIPKPFGFPYNNFELLNCVFDDSILNQKTVNTEEWLINKFEMLKDEKNIRQFVIIIIIQSLIYHLDKKLSKDVDFENIIKKIFESMPKKSSISNLRDYYLSNKGLHNLLNKIRYNRYNEIIPDQLNEIMIHLVLNDLSYISPDDIAYHLTFKQLVYMDIISQNDNYKYLRNDFKANINEIIKDGKDGYENYIPSNEFMKFCLLKIIDQESFDDQQAYKEFLKYGIELIHYSSKEKLDVLVENFVNEMFESIKKYDSTDIIFNNYDKDKYSIEFHEFDYSQKIKEELRQLLDDAQTT